ncbi:MAG TPA: hypothetical protein VLS49_14890 [Usitatibacter sp.]|nr:hypothetical protein [Usitatibacter sp.]
MAVERVKAWQCIGCGRIEAPQECVGVCEFKRLDMVYAFEHEQALEAERAKCGRLEALVRHLARITPREGEFERSWRALQEQARRALAECEGRAAGDAAAP